MERRPAYRVIPEAQSAYLLFREGVSAINEDGAAHGCFYPGQIDLFKLLPLCQQAQRVAVLRSFQRRAAPLNPGMIPQPPEIIHSHRVVYLRSGAKLNEPVDDLQCRSLPDIIGFWLEGQPPQRNGSALGCPVPDVAC